MLTRRDVIFGSALAVTGTLQRSKKLTMYEAATDFGIDLLAHHYRTADHDHGHDG